MSNQPIDPDPPSDIADAGDEPTPGSTDDSDDADDGRDAMGIDDSDPLDATLVGSPVDQDRQTGSDTSGD